MYEEASQFGLQHLTNEANSTDSFLHELIQQVMEADLEQTLLIVLDFLIGDYV